MSLRWFLEHCLCVGWQVVIKEQGKLNLQLSIILVPIGWHTMPKAVHCNIFSAFNLTKVLSFRMDCSHCWYWCTCTRLTKGYDGIGRKSDVFVCVGSLPQSTTWINVEEWIRTNHLYCNIMICKKLFKGSVRYSHTARSQNIFIHVADPKVSSACSFEPFNIWTDRTSKTTVNWCIVVVGDHKIVSIPTVPTTIQPPVQLKATFKPNAAPGKLR